MLAVIKRFLHFRATAGTSSNHVAEIRSAVAVQPAPALPVAAEHESAIVAFDEREIYCTYKSKAGGSVKWQNLCEVGIVTTDAGPAGEDLYWILVGETGSCIVPGTAMGCDRLLARLQQLPEFDNLQVIRAMSSTGRGRFICWRRRGDFH
jgi:hypothetical protein